MYRKEFLLLLTSSLISACTRTKNYKYPLANLLSYKKVVIIGAGVAGLHAAKTLYDIGIRNIQIIEAKNRWGGRINTNYGFASFPIELGAEIIHGENSEFKKTVDKQRVPLIEFDASAFDYFYYQGKLQAESTLEENVLFDLAMQVTENLEYFGGTDIPVSKLLEQFPFANDLEILAFLNASLGNENGTNNDLLSASIYNKYTLRSTSGNKNFLLLSGLQDILKKEYNDILPLIQYNKVVNKIDSTSLKIKVNTIKGNEFDADHVIITVPVSILKKNKIQFIPNLPFSKQNAIQRIGMEAGMKIILQFSKSFWPSNLRSLFCSGIVPEFWTTGLGRGENVYLTGFVMGPNASYLSNLSKIQQENEVLNQLSKVFGYSTVFGNFKKSIVMDWLKEDHINGSYSSTPVGSDGAFEILSEPIDNRIHFAGEATRSDGSHQTVHGAMLSGIKVATEIIGKIFLLFITYLSAISMHLNTVNAQEIEKKKTITPEIEAKVNTDKDGAKITKNENEIASDILELELANLKPEVSLFVDTYYSHSSLRYKDNARQYGTQIMNDKEFSINHALINFEKKNQSFRYGFGFHTGTYVQTNYILEPKELQYIYQAYAGIPLTKNLWLDVGIFPSHLGGESAISFLNFNYTRSLIAENSPYYESGARLQYQATEKLLLGLYVINGWQKIKEDNRDKASGFEVKYKLTGNWTINYSTYAGNESPDFEPRQTRYFQDLFLKGKIFQNLEIYLAYDLGFQKKKAMSWTEYLESTSLWPSKTPRDSFYRWQGFSLQFYYHFNQKWKLGIRGEGFYDKNQVIVQTGTIDGYQVHSGSINIDYFPMKYALVRIEAKHINNINPIFIQDDRDPATTDNVLTFNLSFKI
ncbi:MAG: outer membrane beta-barrel protein [Leptospiraceae bacterium]|nr:outer membrane beta-barrel protein [Leptospiraceae bacterium]